MNRQLPPADLDRWLRPDQPGDAPDHGYDEWLEAELAAGLEDIRAGRVVPLEDVLKEFGLA
jgi:hypothetical protein